MYNIAMYLKILTLVCMQAIVESNPFGIDYNTNTEEKKIGREVAGKLGCKYL